MKGTFTYDFVSFLRVLYRRRWFIGYGTIGIAVLMVIVSLLWPETWRAQTSILVTTPKYKEDLRLVPQPFDVKTYQGLLSSDNLYKDVLFTLRWNRQVLAQLTAEEAQSQIKNYLGDKAQNMSPFELVQNTNALLISRILFDADTPPAEYQNHVAQLANYSAVDLEVIHEMDPAMLEDLSVFDLRKMLNTSVSIVKETNLETVYSNLIDVSAEFDTAIGSRILCNIWVRLFVERAEETVENVILKQVEFIQNSASAMRDELDSAKEKLATFKSDGYLEYYKARAASIIVDLFGLSLQRNQVDQQKNEYDYLDDYEPFLKQYNRYLNILTYEVTPGYQEALLPQKSQLDQKIATVQTLLDSEAVSDTKQQELKMEQTQLLARRSALTKQIKESENELVELLDSITELENQLAVLRSDVQRAENGLEEQQPLLNEAKLISSRNESYRYADISPNLAITPDKRVWPRRSIMVIAGTGIGFILLCGLCFFLDIWHEVTRPDDDESGSVAV